MGRWTCSKPQLRTSREPSSWWLIASAKPTDLENALPTEAVGFVRCRVVLLSLLQTSSWRSWGSTGVEMGAGLGPGLGGVTALSVSPCSCSSSSKPHWFWIPGVISTKELWLHRLCLHLEIDTVFLWRSDVWSGCHKGLILCRQQGSYLCSIIQELHAVRTVVSFPQFKPVWQICGRQGDVTVQSEAGITKSRLNCNRDSHFRSWGLFLSLCSEKHFLLKNYICPVLVFLALCWS